MSPPNASLDIVYINRPGEENEELRYSLRSLRNLPHGRVWVVGYCPSWVQGVEVVSIEAQGGKQASAYNNLIAALNAPEVSDPFVIFNDDFYVMQPMEEIPILHLGELDPWIEAHRQGHSYRVAAERTRDRLREELPDKALVSYESHMPMTIEKLGMQLALSLGQGIPGLHNRTMYGNLMEVGGTQTEDFKMYRTDTSTAYKEWPFLSTSDRTFRYHHAGRFVRERFSDPSPYEKPLPIGRRDRAIRYQSVVVRP